MNIVLKIKMILAVFKQIKNHSYAGNTVRDKQIILKNNIVLVVVLPVEGSREQYHSLMF